jgi:hypothetical protein
VSQDKDFTAGLMQAAALGVMPRSIVAMVTEAFEPERLTLEQRRFLAGPLVIHQNAWTDTLPGWFNDAVSAERIGIVFGVTPDYIVGPAEIAAVMYPATMASPLSHYHVELYLWAVINADAKRKALSSDKLFREVLNMEPIEDRQVLKPGGRLYDIYRRLANDIRRKVVEHQAGRDRSERRESEVSTPEPAIEVQPVTAAPKRRLKVASASYFQVDPETGEVTMGERS